MQAASINTGGMLNVEQPASQDDWARLANGLRSGSVQGELLRAKRAAVRTMRWTGDVGRTVIAKLWSGGGWKAAIRRLAGVSGAQREWNALRRLSAAGVPVPAALAYVRPGGACDEALFVEDLGRVERCVDVLKRLVVEGRQAEADELQARVVQITAGVWRAGMVDEDHSMMNLAMTAGGRVVRLDLELARRRPLLGGKQAGKKMLRRLVATHQIAAGPDQERVAKFGADLSRELGVPMSEIEELQRAARAAPALHSA
jgi:hypothetical protein